MTASADDIAGAMLPEGILVDEAAAYYGHTGSSDIIDRLNRVDRLNGMGEFLSLTSDLLLTDTFDTDVVSQRLGCEAGEIYFLLSGPFGLLSMTDAIRIHLGQEDSTGERRPTEQAVVVSPEEHAILDSFNDPLRLLTMFAVGHTCGGLQELDLYIANIGHWMTDVEGNKLRLMALHHQLEQVLASTRQRGDATSLTVLSGGIQIRASIPEPPVIETPEPVQTPQMAQTPTTPSTPTMPGALEPAPQTSPMPPQPPAPQVQPVHLGHQPAGLEQQSVTALQPVAGQTAGVDAAQDAFSAAFDSHGSATSQSGDPFQQPPAAPAPTGSEAPPPEMFGQQPSAQPSFGPLGGQQTAGQPDAFGTPPLPKPVRRQIERSGGGKVRNASVPGVRHAIQTGMYCGGCGIGVEHHWRHCPLCAKRLI